MNKLIFVMLIGIGFIAAGCEKQQSQTSAPAQETVASQVGEDTTVVQQEAQAVVSEAQQNVQTTAGDMAEKARALLAEAQQSLADGKIQEAITVAQNVLTFDPQNIDAKKILETAKAKITSAAQEQMGDLKNSFMNKVNSVNQ